MKHRTKNSDTMRGKVIVLGFLLFQILYQVKLRFYLYNVYLKKVAQLLYNIYIGYKLIITSLIWNKLDIYNFYFNIKTALLNIRET